MSTQTSKIVFSDNENLVSINFSWLLKETDHLFTLTWINPNTWAPNFTIKFPHEWWISLLHELSKIEELSQNWIDWDQISKLIQRNTDKALVGRFLSSILSREDLDQIILNIDLDQVDFSWLLWIAKLQKFIDQREANKNNSNESYWQWFFESNIRILQQIFSYPTIYLQGETYVWWKNTKGRNGQWGVATDFLLSSLMCWSFAVIEIKTPQTPLLWSQYRWSENWQTNISYSLSHELSWGIIQALNQVHTAIDYFKSNIGDDFSNTSFYHPQSVLICWSNESLADDQSKIKSFSLFRKNSKDVIIITFDELLEKAKSLLHYIQTNE